MAYRSTLLPLLLAITRLAAAQTDNSDFNNEYNSAKSTISAGKIAIIVSLSLVGLGIIGGLVFFWIVVSRSKKRRALQAQEIQRANQRIAARRAAEADMEAGMPMLENYQYGPGYAVPTQAYDPYRGASEMDASREVVEVDSRPKIGSELP